MADVSSDDDIFITQNVFSQSQSLSVFDIIDEILASEREVSVIEEEHEKCSKMIKDY
jgi:hypothetical protein